MSHYYSVCRSLLTAILLFVIGCGSASAADALVQFVHASAWPRAEKVDLYLDEVKPPEFDNFAFATATPYLEIPAGRELTIDIAPSHTTTNREEVYATSTIGPFEAGKRYVAILCGVDGDNWPSGAAGRDISLRFVTSEFSPAASDPEYTELRLFNGLTDAGALNVYPDYFIREHAIAENLDYAVLSPAWRVPNPESELQGGVFPRNGEEKFPMLLFQFGFNSDPAGKVFLAFITGFENRGDQPCVPPPTFDSQLILVLENGNTIDTRLPFSVANPAREIAADGVRVFPTPLQRFGRVEFELNSGAFVQVEIVDQRGLRTVLSGSRFYPAGEQAIGFATEGLTPGVYGLRLRTPSGVRNTLIQIVN